MHGNAAGTLSPQPALRHRELLAAPVAAALVAMDPGVSDRIRVAAIDPAVSDTAEFCARYGVPLDAAANCVVIRGRRGSEVRFAACMVLATTRADVNGIVRRRLDARTASFSPMEETVAATGMEYGGITPIGLPPEWPILIDAAVYAAEEVVIGSGIRGSKLFTAGRMLSQLANAEVVQGLARRVA